MFSDVYGSNREGESLLARPGLAVFVPIEFAASG